MTFSVRTSQGDHRTPGDDPPPPFSRLSTPPEADIADTDAQYQYRLTLLVLAYTIGAPKQAPPRSGTLGPASEITDDGITYLEDEHSGISPGAPLPAGACLYVLLSLDPNFAVNSGPSMSFPVTIRVTGYSHSIDVAVRR